MGIKSLFIIILVLLVLKNIYPLVLNVLNPDKNLEDAPFGKFIITHLHGTEFKESILWISLIILEIILIMYCIKKIENKAILIPIIAIIIYLNYIIVFPLTTIQNIYLKYSLPVNKPFINNINEIFPQNKILEKNFNVYKNELNNYINDQKNIECVHSKTPGFIIGKTEEKCWRTLQIKTAGNFVNGFENICPELYKILDIKNVNNAFLSILDPFVNIPKHVGYSRAYLRYHMGIDIPKTENKPFIVCGNEKYTWKEGKGVIFDDMYVHYVENPTPFQRVVLYIDLIRPELMDDIYTNFLVNMLNNNIVVKRYNKNQHNSKSLN